MPGPTESTTSVGPELAVELAPGTRVDVTYARDAPDIDAVRFVDDGTRLAVRLHQNAANAPVVVVVPSETIRAWSAGAAVDGSQVRVVDRRGDTEYERPLPPFDSHTLFQQPPGRAYPGVDFFARLELTATPIGAIVATLQFESGQPIKITPGEPPADATVKATMPLAQWLRYRTGRAKIYELFAEGAVVEADPILLMFIAGFFDFPETHAAFAEDAGPAEDMLIPIGRITADPGLVAALVGAWNLAEVAPVTP